MVIIAVDSEEIPRFLLVDSSGRLIIKLTDGTTNISVDADTGGLKIIDVDEAILHDGNQFSISHFFSNLADNGNADIRITVGSTKKLHVTISVNHEGKGEVYFYEDTTFSVAGTAITIYNHNRSSGTSSTAIAKYTPTVDALGTNIFQAFVPGGARQQAVGSAKDEAAEWILKTSTEYLIRFTNRSGADKDASILIQFSEE